jgi:acyl-CoA reductase-like NAD-dependent aldehyde dehydrogenase
MPSTPFAGCCLKPVRKTEGLDHTMLAVPQCYISGQWHKVPALSAQSICDANSGAPLQSLAAIDDDLIEAAVESAQACHLDGTWARDLYLRAAVLENLAAILGNPQRIEDIAVADSITTGVVIATSRRLAALLPALFLGAANVIREGYLGQTHSGRFGPIEHFRRPWGPALLISPWNSPTPIGGHKLASALAAGAPAIVKPSSMTPHSAVAMFEAIHAVGLPIGAATLLLGDRHMIGPLLSDRRVRAVSFTGGLFGGRAIAQACAHDFKPTQLELGGNNALVVLDGADIDDAARAIVFGLANLNGQWCRALGRIIVARALKTVLLDAVLEKLARLRLGSSLDETSQMGPQAHERQFNDVTAAIAALVAKGGTALSATILPKLPGYFVAPTLIDGCNPQDTRHEIFGPVATIHCFDTEAEALALANDAPYGLAGYVFGRQDQALAFGREMTCGGVKVNGYSLMALDGDLPRGAWQLSGLGEEGRRETVRFFTGSRIVGVSPQDVLGG